LLVCSLHPLGHLSGLLGTALDGVGDCLRERETEDSRDPEADDEQDDHAYSSSAQSHLRDPVKVPLVKSCDQSGGYTRRHYVNQIRVITIAP
jgi:hypothetical protein